MLFKGIVSLAVLLGAASAAAVPEADEGNLTPAEAVSIDNLPANFEKRQGGGYRCAPGKPCGEICIPRDRNCCGNEGHWCKFCTGVGLTAQGYYCPGNKRCHNTKWCI
jgi:hypothetical protein